MNRDMQLMGLGWECGPDGARLPPDGEWIPISKARIAAGLDKAAEPFRRITITALTGDMANVIAAIRFGDVVAGFTAPLTDDEQTELKAFLSGIAARLDQESRL